MPPATATAPEITPIVVEASYEVHETDSALDVVAGVISDSLIQMNESVRAKRLAGPKPSQALVDRRLATHAELPARAARRHWRGQWPSCVDRDDLAQIAHMSLWRAAQEVPAGNEEQFVKLAQTTMNRDIIDYRRTLLGRKGEKLAFAHALELKPEIYDQAQPEGISFEERDQLREALKTMRMSDQQRKVLGMLLLDYTMAEIGLEMGLTPSRISQIVSKMRKRLGTLVSS